MEVPILKFTPNPQSRRAFLRGSAATMAGIVTAQAASGTQADPLITEVQDWASVTGDGVDATPYGARATPFIRLNKDAVSSRFDTS